MGSLNITGPTDTTLADLLGGGAASVTGPTTMQSAATTTGNGTSLNVAGMATAMLLATFAAGTGTIIVEGSPDDTAWATLYVQRLDGTVAASIIQTATLIPFRVNVVGLKSIRARISAVVTGPITVVGWAQANEGPLPQTNVGIYAPGSTTGAFVTTPADSFSNANTALLVAAGGSQYNGASWDRQRNNTDTTLLASAARTVLTNSPDQVLYNHRAVRVDIDVTAVAGSPSLVFKVQTKDSLSGVYVDVLTATAITAAGHVQLQVGAGAPTVANLAASVILGRIWRVVCTPGTADSCTYSVSASAS